MVYKKEAVTDVFYKKIAVRNFLKIRRKTFLSECLASGLNFIKKTPRHKCFPVNFATFLRTLFTDHLWATAASTKMCI